MKMMLVALLLTLAASPLQAQAPIIVPSLPTILQVSWDDANLPIAKPDVYIVTYDNKTPVEMSATQPTPCTACASTQITVETAGSHTVTIVGRNGAGASAPLSLTFKVGIVITVPGPVSNITLGLPVPPVTPAPITDTTGAVWTMGAAISCPAGALIAVCKPILRNNVQKAIGDGLLYVNLLVYHHGPTNLWYEWHDPEWWEYSPTAPR